MLLGWGQKALVSCRTERLAAFLRALDVQPVCFQAQFEKPPLMLQRSTRCGRAERASKESRIEKKGER